MACAVKKAREARLLRTLASTDELTGLPNRRTIIAYAEKLAHLIGLHGGRLSVLMIEVDRSIEFTPTATSAGELRLTVSIGISEVMDSSESITALLARADAALYKAKTSGRNPVVGSAPVVPPARRTSA